MGPSEAIVTGLRKYAAFTGRAGRGEYWWLLAAAIAASLALSGGVWLARIEPARRATLESIFALLIFVPLVSAGFRRLHDSGRSGWLMPVAVAASAGAKLLTIGSILNFTLITPIATGRAAIAAVIATATALILWVLVALAQPSQPGPNRYGPNPLEVTP